MVKLGEVRRYWESRLPGVKHSHEEMGSKAFFDEIEYQRYTDFFKYRYLPKVAEFDKHPGQRVLEVGVGLGTDISQFAKNGANVYGIDLTSSAIEMTSRRFQQAGLEGSFQQASFTGIPFKDGSFDVVYCFGVLHHSEETQQGIDEIHRILKPGGRVIALLYHKGFTYYVRTLFRHGVLKGEYLRSSTQAILNRHTEEFGNSPLTKAYSRRDARAMFKEFELLSLECYRLGDDIPFMGRRFSPARLILFDRAYRALENLVGWNMIIKGSKPSAEPMPAGDAPRE